MIMDRKPTLPVAPWDIPAPAPDDDWDRTPDEITIERARLGLGSKKKRGRPRKADKSAMHGTSTAQYTPVHDLVGRTFMGALNVSDLHYLAMALLQMHDELCELRERVRQMEACQKRGHVQK